MPYDIRKRGDQFCVIKRDDNESMGCHDTRAAAVRQLGAIEASENEDKALTVYKDDNGIRHMLIVTSNSYKDREGEYISTEALKGYVDSQWSEDDTWQGDNVLMFWHDGPPIGDIIHADMDGPFLFEVARERTSGLPFIQHYAKAIWDYVENNPNEEWGASHGFGYNPGDKEMTPDGPVYHNIRKFETSILPVEYAANAYTVSGVIKMNEKRDEKLNEIAPGFGGRIRALLGGEKDKLDAVGAQHKALGPQVTRQDIIDVAALAIEIAATKSKSDDDDGEQMSMKDAIGEALDDLMEVPTVNIETAEAILAVEDEPDSDEQSDAVDDATQEAHEHEHGDREPSALEKALTGLVSFNEQLVTEQKAFVDAMPKLEELTTALKALGSYTEELEALRGEVADLQDEFKQRPRASQSTATIPAADDERAKKATTEPSKAAFNYPTKS